MADYNPKTVSAYQQYASSMKAGGGGTNLSGSGAKAPPKMQTEYGRKGLGSPTSRLDKKGYTPTTSLSTASGQDYVDNVSSEKDLPSANPAAILYSAAANANMAAGVTQTPSPLTPMDGMSLYSLKKMTEVVPQVTPYLYRVDMQEQTQDLVEQAMGYEPPLAQMTPNRSVWDYEKYSSLSSEEQDKAAEALQIVGERKMTPAEIKQFQPLIDMANEIANETITVEELAPLTQMDQEAKLKDILQVIESGGLSRITNIREVRSDNAVDPVTGLPIGGDELGFTDVSPAEEAPDQLGLMSRSRVPTGSIEEAVREAYDLEEAETETPAVEAAAEEIATEEDLVGDEPVVRDNMKVFGWKGRKGPTTKQKEAFNRLRDAAVAKGIVGDELRQLLAQAAVESAWYTAAVEGSGGAASKISGGSDYLGRGPLQLTHDYNYKEFGEAKGVGDLYVDQPELLADPDLGTEAALWYWENYVQPKVSDFSDTYAVSGAINRGDPKKKALHLKDRKQAFQAIRLRDVGVRPMLRPTE